MNLVDIVRRLRADPCAYLDHCCVSSLRTFIYGYRIVDCSIASATDALLNIFPGREPFDVCTRVYLSYSDGAAGVEALLDALEKIVAAGLEPPGDDFFRASNFIDTVRGPILAGRPAMLLGDPTVSSLYNYARGFMCGLEVVAPAEAVRQMRELAAFERWLQDWYEVPGAAWYKLIRVHEGVCEEGTKRFIALWDEFMKARSLS
jgi:hypothetical protein